MVQAVLKHFKRPIVKQNSTIRFAGREHELPEDSRILKPDIWLEEEGVIHLIEVTVPYGTLTENYPKEEEEDDEEEEEDQEGDCMCILEVRRREKVKKYQKLVVDCMRVFNLDCKLT
jgi:hypothetical protein